MAWPVKHSSLINVSQFNYRQHPRKMSLKYISYGTQWYHLTIITCDLLTIFYQWNPYPTNRHVSFQVMSHIPSLLELQSLPFRTQRLR